MPQMEVQLQLFIRTKTWDGRSVWPILSVSLGHGSFLVQLNCLRMSLDGMPNKPGPCMEYYTRECLVAMKAVSLLTSKPPLRRGNLMPSHIVQPKSPHWMHKPIKRTERENKVA